MELLTSEIIEALPPLYSTDKTPLNDKLVICKFFTPDANWTWFIFEGEKNEDKDFEFFGMVHGHFKEMGYFVLSELQSVHGSLGLPIERDISVFKIPYGQLVSQYKR